MTKSTTIIFILIFAILLGLEKKVRNKRNIYFQNIKLNLICIYFFFAELVFNVNCGYDIVGALYVHIQINTVQCPRFCILDICIAVQWHTMVICSINYAKIIVRITQSDRYDLLYAAMDDGCHSTISNWF